MPGVGGFHQPFGRIERIEAAHFQPDFAGVRAVGLSMQLYFRLRYDGEGVILAAIFQVGQLQIPVGGDLQDGQGGEFGR